MINGLKKSNFALGPGSYLKLSVTDTGSGIPDGIKDHIFEPFFTTKKTGQGTGMGLAAVYGTIKNHHGAINIDTTPGKGTTFFIILPQKEILAETLKNEPASQNKKVQDDFSCSILLIEDEETVLETTTELLEEKGFTVYKSSNPIEAIRIYKEAYKKIDLILLDMIMPEMGGAEVYHELLKIKKDIRVIITSGYSIEHEQQLINDNDYASFIQKPYDIEDLCVLINEVLHKH